MRTVQGELKSLQDNQRLLAILIFSLVTIVIWIGFSLVSSQTTSSISPELQAMAKPLDPTINTDVLNEIAGKKEYTADELQNFTIYSVKISGNDTNVFSQGTQETVTPTSASESAQTSNSLGSLNSLLTTPLATNSGTTATTSGQTTGP